MTMAPVLSASAGWAAAVIGAPEAWWTRDRWHIEALVHQPIRARDFDVAVDLAATWNRGTAYGSPLPLEFVALDPLAIGDLAPFRIRAAVEMSF